MSKFYVRAAQKQDISIVFKFIKLIAEYEKMSEHVLTNEESLEKELFFKKSAEVIVGFEDDKPVAFALYYYNFSTFLGTKGLYLEDIFVCEEYRAKGYGTQMFKALSKIAFENSVGRMEWRCLKWNEASLSFYEKLGAKKLNDWVSLTLDKNEIEGLSKN